MFLLKDLESDPPARDDATSDAAVMAAAAAAAGPVPGKERALYTPMYLFNAAEVMQRGWATPRLEPWGLVTHLVGFGDAWGQVRLAVPWPPPASWQPHQSLLRCNFACPVFE